MMARRRRLSVLVTLTIGAALFAHPPVDAQGLVFDRFRDYLEALRAQAGIPGLSAAIVSSEEIVWEHAFGRQNVERAIATRTDTPFHLDGLTQVFTASLVLRCVEEGRLSLDDPLSRFESGDDTGDLTIGETLAHLSDGVRFDYRPERLDSLASAIEACSGDSFQETVGDLLDRLGMADSVPGPDSTRARHRRLLDRLATPYRVDTDGRASATRYQMTSLTPSGGLISTVRNLAEFDVAIRRGDLLRDETVAMAWSRASGRSGRSVVHGLGWFVQPYNGIPVVWQFGVGADASSALLVTLPARGLTLILLANSDGLVRPFRLTTGDLTASPFGRLFLGLFAR